LKNNLKYEQLEEEILNPLKAAETIAPFDPFIQLKKAQVLLEFNKTKKSKEAALNALNIEPEYVSALYFLKKYFNQFPDESSFKELIKKIRAKADKLQLKPNSYLYELFKVPEPR
jgi:sulfur relay (sulfurtransferase) DsrC/TusE family protein